MSTEGVENDNAFQRSREHRGGVRRACIELEEALALPAGHDPKDWSSNAASCADRLTEAFRYHVEQSEGPDGLYGKSSRSLPG